MTEALFGFLGVIVGAFVPWLQSMLESRRTRQRDAQYLAIRLVCVLDKFLEDCAAAAADEGEEDKMASRGRRLMRRTRRVTPPMWTGAASTLPSCIPF